MYGPFDEGDLDDDLRSHPVGAHPRQPLGSGEGRLVDFETVESRAKLREQSRVEARPDLAGEHEVAVIEIADEERAQPDATALGIGEAADDEALRHLALHLEPVLRPLLLVRRIEPLGDHPLPSFDAGPLPRLGVFDHRDAMERRTEW